MKSTFFVAMAASLIANAGFANDPATPEIDPKKAAMMKVWQEYATPGEAHKIFDGMAGTWKYESTFWETPTSAPQKSKGTSTTKLILGGRYLQQEVKGETMGMPFEGLGITAYDNIKKKYETIWLDNMGTGITQGTGSFDVATNTLKDKGEFSCPMSKSKTQKYRSEWQITGKNDMIYTMWSPGMETSGKEFKHMEMVFTRR